MLLSDHLNDLRDLRQIKPATVARYRYELTIWSRCGGPLLTAHISGPIVNWWRRSAEIAGLAPRTIESVIQSVCLLAKLSGLIVDPGQKLRHVPQPPDCPTSAISSPIPTSATAGPIAWNWPAKCNASSNSVDTRWSTST